MRLLIPLVLLLNISFVVARNGCVDDPPNWKDKTGSNCNAYRRNSDWCASADDYKSNGISALKACCTCGGGTNDNQSDSCQDNRSWRDKGGMGCDSYVKFPHWCNHAWKYARNGRDANDECCVCQRRSDSAAN